MTLLSFRMRWNQLLIYKICYFVKKWGCHGTAGTPGVDGPGLKLINFAIKCYHPFVDSVKNNRTSKQISKNIGSSKELFCTLSNYENLLSLLWNLSYLLPATSEVTFHFMIFMWNHRHSVWLKTFGKSINISPFYWA